MMVVLVTFVDVSGKPGLHTRAPLYIMCIVPLLLYIVVCVLHCVHCCCVRRRRSPGSVGSSVSSVCAALPVRCVCTFCVRVCVRVCVCLCVCVCVCVC